MERNTDLSLHTTPFPAYESVEKQLSLVRAMAQLSNSGITVYDLQRGFHIYSSFAFYQFFGMEKEVQKAIPNEVFDSRVHPRDLIQLETNGHAALQFLIKVSPMIRKDFKMISEYRIRNKVGQYIWVTEQHHVLELDALGNVWLSLGIMDIAPNQSPGRGVEFQMYNNRLGELINLHPKEPSENADLTVREKEILEMIQKGKLSKEISHMLSISVHTVNTHRQRILGKLNAGNAVEAILSAKNRGIIA